MPFGLQCTIDSLAKSQNLAALDLLLELAVHGHPAFRDQAMELLLTRRDRDLLFGLVRHFHLLSGSQQSRLLREGSRLTNAVRRGYLDLDPVTYQNACTLIQILPDFDQIPLIIGALMKDTPRKADAIRLLSFLAAKLTEEPTFADFKPVPPQVRSHFVQALRDAMRRFVEHRAESVPEAFLLVATDEIPEVRRILHSAADPCHNAIVRILRRSSDPLIMRWVYWLIRTRNPPAPVLTIISERDDRPFVEQLLAKTGIHVEPVVAASLALLKEVSWLEPEHPLLISLPETQQAAAVTFAMKTSVPLDQKLEIAALVLDEGHELARQATAQSLGDLPGVEASRLVQACLEDKDPEVQLAATMQLRNRGLPNALTLLMKQLDSGDERIRAASQHSLADYTMARFLKVFERLEDSARIPVGRAILKIDPNALTTIRLEMKAEQRQYRTRAARIVRVVGASDQLATELMVMLADNDYMVRREAIESLAHCSRTNVVEALAVYAVKGHELSAGALSALEYMRRAAFYPEVRQLANGLYSRLQQAPQV